MESQVSVPADPAYEFYLKIFIGSIGLIGAYLSFVLSKHFEVIKNRRQLKFSLAKELFLFREYWKQCMRLDNAMKLLSRRTNDISINLRHSEGESETKLRVLHDSLEKSVLRLYEFLHHTGEQKVKSEAEIMGLISLVSEYYSAKVHNKLDSSFERLFLESHKEKQLHDYNKMPKDEFKKASKSLKEDVSKRAKEIDNECQRLHNSVKQTLR